jgi:hypothetical protein
LTWSPAALLTYRSTSSYHKSSHNSLGSALGKCATHRPASTSTWPLWTPHAAVSMVPDVSTVCQPRVRKPLCLRPSRRPPDANDNSRATCWARRRRCMRSEAGSTPRRVCTVPRLARRRSDAPRVGGGGCALYGCVQRVSRVCGVSTEHTQARKHWYEARSTRHEARSRGEGRGARAGGGREGHHFEKRKVMFRPPASTIHLYSQHRREWLQCLAIQLYTYYVHSTSRDIGTQRPARGKVVTVAHGVARASQIGNMAPRKRYLVT